MKHIFLPRRVVLQFFVVLSFVIISHLNATQVIPNPVNPQIGENLWQMNYRQSVAIDDIMDTTTMCCTCDYFITQADIDGNGGGFVIDRPGNWCVAAPLFTSSPIVIANQENVALDLRGRTIRSSVVDDNIIYVSNSPGTKIFNGSLVGTDLGGISSLRIGILLDGSDNTIVENIQASFQGTIDDPSNAQSSIGFATSGSTRGAYFKNCSASGVYLLGFGIDSSYCTLEGCRVVDFSGDLVNGGTDLVTGVGYYISGSNNYLNSCTSMGGTSQPSDASSGSSGFILEGNNNFARNCTALSHKVQQPGPVPFSSPPGVGFLVIGDNCEISECTSAYNEADGLSNVGSDLILCNNTVHGNGLNYNATTNTNLCNLLCSDYITQDRLPFIITEPGTYCLSENLDEIFGNAAIVVTDGVEDVVIDFGNFSLRRSAVINNEPLITIGDGCVNVSVMNGTIKGNNVSDINNIALGTVTGDTETILFDNMLCAEFFNTIKLQPGISSIFITNCTFSNQLDAVITCSEITNLTIENCDAVNQSSFLIARFSDNINVNSCSIDHSSSTTFAQLDFRNSCENISCNDLQVRSGAFDGILTGTCVNISLAGISTTQNAGSGITIDACQIINCDDIASHKNALFGIGLVASTNGQFNNIRADLNAAGFFGVVITNISLLNSSFKTNTLVGCTIGKGFNINIEQCEAKFNFNRGFQFSGNFPLLTQSNFTVRSCTAQFNIGTGMYFVNVNAVDISDCSFESNGGSGLHLDSVSSYIEIRDCVAILNGGAGFLTWDVGLISGSIAFNRFHACHALSNGMATLPVPGATDFCQANTIGLIQLPAVSGACFASIPMNPPVPVVDLTPGDWSEYG